MIQYFFQMTSASLLLVTIGLLSYSSGQLCHNDGYTYSGLSDLVVVTPGLKVYDGLQAQKRFILKNSVR